MFDDCVRRLKEESRLSPQQAEVYCRKNTGMKVEEIADDLDVSEGAVKSQLQRIRVKTRESKRHVEIMEEYDE